MDLEQFRLKETPLHSMIYLMLSDNPELRPSIQEVLCNL